MYPGSRSPRGRWSRDRARMELPRESPPTLPRGEGPEEQLQRGNRRATWADLDPLQASPSPESAALLRFVGRAQTRLSRSPIDAPTPVRGLSTGRTCQSLSLLEHCAVAFVERPMRSTLR